MFSRMKIGLKRAYHNQFSEIDLSNGSLAVPRLWIIFLVLAIPFFSVCADYFEVLERSGALGAVIADMSLPALSVGYVALVIVLKKRKI